MSATEILYDIVRDDILMTWCNQVNEPCIHYDIEGSTFDEWYSYAADTFLDYYVEYHQNHFDFDSYPPYWVLDVINYERDNYGTNSLYDIGDDYDRFNKYIIYMVLKKCIYEEDDDTYVLNFKEAMSCIYDSILNNEESEEEQEEEEQEEEEQEEEEEQPDREI